MKARDVHYRSRRKRKDEEQSHDPNLHAYSPGVRCVASNHVPLLIWRGSLEHFLMQFSRGKGEINLLAG